MTLGLVQDTQPLCRSLFYLRDESAMITSPSLSWVFLFRCTMTTTIHSQSFYLVPYPGTPYFTNVYIPLASSTLDFPYLLVRSVVELVLIGSLSSVIYVPKTLSSCQTDTFLVVIWSWPQRGRRGPAFKWSVSSTSPSPIVFVCPARLLKSRWRAAHPLVTSQNSVLITLDWVKNSRVGERRHSTWFPSYTLIWVPRVTPTRTVLE